VARNHIILKFLLLSAAAHTLVLASWSTREPPNERISAALSVGFAALEPAATSSASPAATAAQPRSSQPVTAPAAIAKTGSAPMVTPQRAPAKRHDGQRQVSSKVATIPMPSAPRSETAIAKAQEAPRENETPHNVENSASVVARPWEPVWGSVRHDAAKDQIRTANASAMLPRNRLQQTTPVAGEINTVNTSQAARAFIRGRLETDLSRYFSYPPIARQRGWQGHVRVAFTVQADGQLTDARITHSSGYHILDASALEALRRVGRLPQAREWLHGQPLTMELPVIYRLEN
jgi:TonB family protein